MAARASVCAFWVGVPLSFSSTVFGEGTAVEDWLEGGIVGGEGCFFFFFFFFSFLSPSVWVDGSTECSSRPAFSTFKRFGQFLSTSVGTTWLSTFPFAILFSNCHFPPRCSDGNWQKPLLHGTFSKI